MSLPETVSRAGLRMRRMTPSGPQEEVRAAEARTRLRSSCMRALLVPSLFFSLRLVLRGILELQNGGPERSLHRSVAASGRADVSSSQCWTQRHTAPEFC